MISKINILKIIVDHFETHKNYTNGKTNISELILFYVLPIAVALYLVLTGIYFKESIVDILITSFSIFTALLFNLLLLVFDIIRRNSDNNGNEDQRKVKLKNTLLKQVYSNISYSILISIISLLLLLFLQVVSNEVVCKIINFVVFFMALNFILTLLQILKRIHILLSNEF